MYGTKAFKVAVDRVAGAGPQHGPNDHESILVAGLMLKKALLTC